MVKGVSRQVVLVRPPEPKLFEQAIFILRDNVPREGITDEMLLKEANAVANNRHSPRFPATGPIWACCGAGCTALIWLLTALL